MSQEIVQWLNEIKTLQQQVGDLQQILAETHSSAEKWRQLYETEAQQRRHEIQTYQKTLADLQAEMAALKTKPSLPTGGAVDPEILAQVAGIVSLDDLKAKFAQVWADREALQTRLQEEQAAHDRTRKDMTMALADAMDSLRRLREAHNLELPPEI